MSDPKDNNPMKPKPNQNQNMKPKQVNKPNHPNQNQKFNNADKNKNFKPKFKPNNADHAGVFTPMNENVPSTSAPHRVLNDVLSNLECPVCFEFLQAPIFMCETGHNLCGNCRENLCVAICPLCKASVSTQRNFGLEAISASVGTPCPNAKFGCKYMTSAAKEKAHFDECAFRQLFCPIGPIKNNCSWSGTLRDLKAHVLSCHKENMRLTIGSQITFEDFDVYKDDYDVQFVMCEKSLFLYHCKIDVSRNVAMWVIQSIGSDKEAYNWKYELNVYNARNPRKVLCNVEGCQSHLISVESIFNGGDCVGIPLFVLRRFLNEKKQLTFKFFIKRHVPKAVGKVTKATVNDMEKDLAKASII